MCGRNKHRRYRKNKNYTITQPNFVSPDNRDFSNTENIPQSGVYCFQCNFNNTFFADREIKFCQNCGSKIEKCPISKLHFSVNSKFAQCTNCYALFHFHHYQSWVGINEKCPICKYPITKILTGTVGVDPI